jgi:hypothetical protein
MKNKAQTIRNVVAELEEYGISLYGPNIDVENEVEYPALRDWGKEEEGSGVP